MNIRLAPQMINAKGMVSNVIKKHRNVNALCLALLMKDNVATSILIATIDGTHHIAMHLLGKNHRAKGIQGTGNLKMVYKRTDKVATIIMIAKVESVTLKLKDVSAIIWIALSLIYSLS